jgi:hypothetical protein
MGRLVILPLLLAVADGKPHLVVRVAPPVAMADVATGCASVLVTAEIRGPEDEGWYCPAVEWRWPDGTTSMEESDCPPFAERDREGWHRVGETIVDEPAFGYPRRWTRWICLPPHPGADAWEIEVRLSRSGRTVARGVGRAHVR